MTPRNPVAKKADRLAKFMAEELKPAFDKLKAGDNTINELMAHIEYILRRAMKR